MRRCEGPRRFSEGFPKKRPTRGTKKRENSMRDAKTSQVQGTECAKALRQEGAALASPHPPPCTHSPVPPSLPCAFPSSCLCGSPCPWGALGPIPVAPPPGSPPYLARRLASRCSVSPRHRVRVFSLGSSRLMTPLRPASPPNGKPFDSKDQVGFGSVSISDPPTFRHVAGPLQAETVPLKG